MISPSDRMLKKSEQAEKRLHTLLQQRLAALAVSLHARNARFIERIGILGYTFFIFVIFPSFVVAVYLSLIASKEYVSEAQFAVRAASETTASPASDLMSIVSSFTGVRSTGQDAFMVLDYIRSRAIIDDLGGRDFVAAFYAKPSIDWFSRLDASSKFEDFWQYWRSKVTAVIDTQSNILTLRVRAYSPKEAHDLAERIVKQSELLINQVSERSRRDATNRASAEVEVAIIQLAKIRQELLRFRNQSNSIDPLQSAKSLLETLAELSRDKLALENTRESVRKQLADTSPSVRTLETHIGAVSQQIDQVQSQLAGRERADTTIATQLGEYEQLRLQNEFGEKLLSITQSAFQKARAEQDKQQLYLATIAQPAVPEEATFPQPFTGTAVAFALCAVIWSMIALIAASIADHIG